MVDATVNTLLIEFDQVKYEEFLHNNNSISPSKTGYFRRARRVEAQSKSTRGFASSIEGNQYNNNGVNVTATNSMVNAAQTSSSSSIPVAMPKTNPLSNKERKKAFYQAIITSR